MRLFAALLFCLVNLASTELNYPQLVELAKQNSKELQIKKYDIKIQEYALERSFSKYYPTLNMSYNGEYYEDKQNSYSTQSIGDTVLGGETMYKNSVSLNLNYTLFDFGKRTQEVGIQQDAVKIKQNRYCQKLHEIKQQILQHYEKAYKSELQYRYNSSILQLKRQLFKDLQRLQRAGEYAKKDLALKALDIMNLQDKLYQQEQKFTEHMFALREVTGHKLQTDIDAIWLKKPGIGSDTFELPFEKTPQAKAVNKEITRVRSKLEINEISNYPTVSLYGNYYLYGSDPDSYRTSYENVQSNSWKVGIRIGIKLFEGFRYNSEKKRLQAQVQKLQSKKALLRQQYRNKQQLTRQRIKRFIQRRNHNNKSMQKGRQLLQMSNKLRENKQIGTMKHLDHVTQILQQQLQTRLADADRFFESKMLAVLNRSDECIRP